MMLCDENFIIKIEKSADGLTTYVGRAARNSSTDASVWQIIKMVESTVAGVESTDILWAEANDKFKFIWDDRATYSYS